MNGEFHIFTSPTEDSFIVKGLGQGFPQEFDSLFAAARHARAQSNCDAGFVVIYDQNCHAVSRIPFAAGRR